MAHNKAQALENEDPSRGITLRVPCLTKLDEAAIREHVAADEFFSLDLSGPSAGEVEHMGELFDLHPRAVEDTIHLRQRPKLEEFGEYVFVVFYGASGREHDEIPLNEVHLFLSGKYLITVHQDPLPALTEQRSQIEGRAIHSEQFVIYRVLDALTDTFFAPLEAMDDEIDSLEDGIIAQPTDEQLQRIFELKRELAMRKVITPQRDLLATGIDTIAELPGLNLHATILLPLSFLTGFSGMNFAFQVNHIQNSLTVFLLLALGGCAVSVVVLWIYVKRKRWT